MALSAKLMIGAVLGGLMLALGMLKVWHRSPSPIITVAVPDDKAAAANDDDVARCRMITMPDSGCEAVWEAKRRRFFGKDAAR